MNTLEIGMKTQWMDGGSRNGRMESIMKGISKWTNAMALAHG